MEIPKTLCRGEKLVARIALHRSANNRPILDTPNFVGLAFPTGKGVAIEEILWRRYGRNGDDSERNRQKEFSHVIKRQNGE